MCEHEHQGGVAAVLSSDGSKTWVDMFFAYESESDYFELSEKFHEAGYDVVHEQFEDFIFLAPKDVDVIRRVQGRDVRPAQVIVWPMATVWAAGREPQGVEDGFITLEGCA